MITREIRKFLSMVHPDRFPYSPEKRKVNEESMKSLMALLEISHSCRFYMVPQEICFDFYICQQPLS